MGGWIWLCVRILSLSKWQCDGNCWRRRRSCTVKFLFSCQRGITCVRGTGGVGRWWRYDHRGLWIRRGHSLLVITIHTAFPHFRKNQSIGGVNIRPNYNISQQKKGSSWDKPQTSLNFFVAISWSSNFLSGCHFFAWTPQHTHTHTHMHQSSVSQEKTHNWTYHDSISFTNVFFSDSKKKASCCWAGGTASRKPQTRWSW